MKKVLHASPYTQVLKLCAWTLLFLQTASRTVNSMVNVHRKTEYIIFVVYRFIALTCCWKMFSLVLFRCERKNIKIYRFDQENLCTMFKTCFWFVQKLVYWLVYYSTPVIMLTDIVVTVVNEMPKKKFTNFSPRSACVNGIARRGRFRCQANSGNHIDYFTGNTDTQHTDNLHGSF